MSAKNIFLLLLLFAILGDSRSSANQQLVPGRGKKLKPTKRLVDRATRTVREKVCYLILIIREI